MRKSRRSRYKQSKLIKLFVADRTARTAASLVGVNKTTASYYFQRLRQLIYDNSEHLELLEGEAEADESYFGERLTKGNEDGGQLLKCPYWGF